MRVLESLELMKFGRCDASLISCLEELLMEEFEIVLVVEWLALSLYEFPMLIVSAIG